MKRHLANLIILTVFAILFLVTYWMYSVEKNNLQKAKLSIRGYELYAQERYGELSEYIEKNRLSELKYLLIKSQERSFQNNFSEATSAFNLGNYATTVDIIRKILQNMPPQKQDRYDDCLYLLSLSLVRSERWEEAKIELEELAEMQDSEFQKRAIELLKEVYEKTGDEEKFQELSKRLEGNKQ